MTGSICIVTDSSWHTFLTAFSVSQDLEIVYSYLHGMEALSNLREHQLRSAFTHVAHLKLIIVSTS